MKYIRTKNGIYDSNRPDIKKHGFYISNYEQIIYHTNEKILKEADTIDELCDGYIFKDTNANKIHLAKKGEEDGMFILGAALFSETVRYFIETDKGLIYVAKMNEKGELCLL